MEELRDITEINYEGKSIRVIEYEIIKNSDHHAAKFYCEDCRVFQVPLQGYNEQSGDYWAIMWDGLVQDDSEHDLRYVGGGLAECANCDHQTSEWVG